MVGFLLNGSLIANDAEHLFMHLSAICRSFFVKCLFKSFTHFLKMEIVHLLRDGNNFFIYSGYTPSFIKFMYDKYFLPVCGLPFCFLTGVF